MGVQPSRWQRFWREAQALLDENAPQLQGWRSRLHRFVHFWVMVWKSLVRNRLPVRASALAYATLLALVPMLAVVVSVTSTFLKQEGEDRIDQFIEKIAASLTPPGSMATNAVGAETNGTGILTNVAGLTNDLASSEAPAVSAETNVTSIALKAAGTNQTVLPAFLQQQDAVDARKNVARKINEFIQNTRSGTLGVTGSIVLIFVAISMLSRIEDTFNDIWGVPHGRSWYMRIVLYWGVITLAPLLLVVALGLATGPHVQAARNFVLFSPFLASVLFRLLPVLLLSLTFSVFYLLVPNTHVNKCAALAGGFTAGLLFHFNNLISVLYVSRVVSNSKIYGSLGLVPVFMIGLYFSWLILLFGAQVAYAWQNRATYLEAKQIENINQRGREFVALRLMTCIGQAFEAGQSPPTISQMARQLGIPSRLAQQVLQTLTAAHLVIEAAGQQTGYAPARPLAHITCHDVLLAMRAAQGHELATRDEPVRAEVYGEFQRIQEAERHAAVSVNLLALVNRARAKAIAEDTEV